MQKVVTLNRQATEDISSVGFMNKYKVSSLTQCSAIMQDHTPFDLDFKVQNASAKADSNSDPKQNKEN